jgi:hypothetical protein
MYAACAHDGTASGLLLTAVDLDDRALLRKGLSRRAPQPLQARRRARLRTLRARARVP